MARSEEKCELLEKISDCDQAIGSMILDIVFRIGDKARQKQKSIVENANNPLEVEALGLDDLSGCISREAYLPINTYAQTNNMKLFLKAVDKMLEVGLIKGWFLIRCDFSVRDKLSVPSFLCASPEDMKDLGDISVNNFEYKSWLEQFKIILSDNKNSIEKIIEVGKDDDLLVLNIPELCFEDPDPDSRFPWQGGATYSNPLWADFIENYTIEDFGLGDFGEPILKYNQDKAILAYGFCHKPIAKGFRRTVLNHFYDSKDEIDNIKILMTDIIDEFQDEDDFSELDSKILEKYRDKLLKFGSECNEDLKMNLQSGRLFEYTKKSDRVTFSDRRFLKQLLLAD